MDFEIKSKVEPKVEFLPLENLTKITCPKNSEGTIHLVVDIEYSFHLIIEENAHWTINVEYEKGLIISNNTVEVKEYGSLKHNIICYENKELHYEKYVYFMLNKPAGLVSATKDNFDKTVLDLLKDENVQDVFPVGRLDKDTEGLLFLTNDAIGIWRIYQLTVAIILGYAVSRTIRNH